MSSNKTNIAFEINLQKALSKDNKDSLLHLANLLDHYSSHYKKTLVYVDFSVEAENKVMKDFL